MVNRPLTRKEWMDYLEKACDEFDWEGASKPCPNCEYHKNRARQAAGEERMTTQPTPQQNTAAYISGFEDGKRVNAAELRRLYAVNQDLLGALHWIADRCPVHLSDHPLHGIHREMAHDAGARARAAIARAEGRA